MRRYTDYITNPKNKRKRLEKMTKEEMNSVEWAKYKIVVPTEADRQEVMDALEHFHDSMFDSDIVTANQLAHEYLTPEREPGSKNNIIVDPILFEKLNKGENFAQIDDIVKMILELNYHQRLEVLNRI